MNLTRRHALIGAALAPTLAAARAEPRRQLVVGMSGWPPALDPVLYNHTATRRLMPQIFDTLLRFDHAHDMALAPGLAERWERQDERTLRLTLRRGVTFHDGAPLTAADIAFSFSPTRLNGRQGQTVALETLARIETVETPDTHTAVIRSKGPDTLLEQRLAAWCSEIVSQRAFEAAGSWEHWGAAPVGSGPYRVVDLRTDVHVRLEAHPGYWGGRPPFDTLEFRIVPEQAARVAGLRAGDLDLITDVAPDQFADIASQPGLEVTGGAVRNARYLGIDTTAPLLSDVRLRQALSLAIDRRTFVDSLWAGRVSVPRSWQFESFGSSFVADHPAPAYDPDRARALLREMGYGGEPITYRLLNNYYTNQVSGAQVLIEMWAAVGLRVEIEMLEGFTQIYRKPINAIWDSSNTAVLQDHMGHPWRLFGPNGNHVRMGVWKNAGYEALGARMENVTDPAERQALNGEMLRLLDREVPAVILHASGQFYGKRKDVPWQPGQTLDMDLGPLNPALRGA